MPKHVPLRICANLAQVAMIMTLAFVFLVVAAFKKEPRTDDVIIWKLKDLGTIDGHKTSVWGTPFFVRDDQQTGISFNGINDGIIIPHIPLEGWPRFTIEVLFKPAADGPAEPRFMHFQDSAINRGTFELRVKRDGNWYLDAFLKNGQTNKGLTLIDSTKLHPAGKWYWAAMTYTGKHMTSYINGKKELEGDIDIPAFTSGNLSLGVRLNKVNWFKGIISEVRYHPLALEASGLQHF